MKQKPHSVYEYADFSLSVEKALFEQPQAINKKGTASTLSAHFYLTIASLNIKTKNIILCVLK
ncbi:MAG: hypothetical protein GXO79_04245 [Chlorobi bacterium]|nr:hypothetical protein [Chlorobiota bacterium]